jgi:hypothetical protein
VDAGRNDVANGLGGVSNGQRRVRVRHAATTPHVPLKPKTVKGYARQLQRAIQNLDAALVLFAAMQTRRQPDVTQSFA